MAVPNRILFHAPGTGDIWVSDGTTPGTTVLGGTITPTYFTQAGANVVFSAGTSTTGLELWVTDGKTTGTSLLADIRPGASGSQPGHFASLGSNALFSATDASHGNELWITDGTAACTSLLKDIFPGGGSNGSFPTHLTTVGNHVLFQAYDGTNGYELWTTDGTSAGTSMVKDIKPGAFSSAPGDGGSGFAVLGDKTVFAAFDTQNNANTRSLWISDGTAAGTQPVITTTGLTLRNLTSFGTGKAIFTLGSPTIGEEPWVTDGTPGGTSLIKDMRTGSTSSNAGAFAAFNGQALFNAADGSPETASARAPFITDGTSGATRPIRWIGHRVIAVAGHPDPAAVRPIRLRAGAIAPGLPARDLRLSPDHALFLDGVLIPAHALVNGATILRETATTEVTYFHVELDRHDILLAEGLPAESYLDTGNRDAFANATVTRLHADFAPKTWSEDACAPHVAAGPALDAVRARLAARAHALGWRPAPTPGLTLLADGRPLATRPAMPGTFDIEFPRGTRTIRLAVAAIAPADLDRAADDRRPLGVCVTGLSIATADWTRALPLDDTRLGAGWHEPERDGPRQWRWTADDAAIDTTGLIGLRVTFDAAQPGWAHDATIATAGTRQARA